MTRTELKKLAKGFVFSHGPSNCLEFPGEILSNYYMPDQLTTEERAYLMDQMNYQVVRVMEFLGEF